jgi:hypothetical protein
MPCPSAATTFSRMHNSRIPRYTTSAIMFSSQLALGKLSYLSSVRIRVPALNGFRRRCYGKVLKEQPNGHWLMERFVLSRASMLLEF